MHICTIYRNDAYKGTRRTFIVLGAPRGGTSVVSGSVQILGVPMGSANSHQHEDPEFTHDTTIKQKIKTIKRRNNYYQKWGWKFPNNIYYLNELIHVIINPVFIVVFRNPLKIMNSATKHDLDELHDGHFMAPFNHYHKLSKLVVSNSTIPTFLFSFEDIIEKPDEYIKDITSVIMTSPSENRVAECKEFINPFGYRKISSDTFHQPLADFENIESK